MSLLILSISPLVSAEPGGTDGAALQDVSGILASLNADGEGPPALAAVVISGDRVVARGVTGERVSGSGVLATFDDRWHIGSCTKSMTATMIAVLVERGDLSWETTLEEVFPELVPTMDPRFRSVTVEMLVQQRGGVSDVPAYWWFNGSPTERRAFMTANTLALPPAAPPGEYRYSNCNVAVAGHVAERVTGIAWEDLMVQFVFEPLGMDSAGYGVPWDSIPPTDPWGHDQSGMPVTPGPNADNSSAIGPAATVHVSLDDWAKYAIDHLNGSRGEPGTLLLPETYQRLHSGPPTGTGTDRYASGWQIILRSWARGDEPGDSGVTLHHGGTNTVFLALLWVCPEIDAAFLAVGNQNDFGRVDAVIWSMIQYHAGRFRSGTHDDRDITYDGAVDFFDVTAFLRLFDAENPTADCAAPLGVFDESDVQGFLNALE